MQPITVRITDNLLNSKAILRAALCLPFRGVNRNVLRARLDAELSKEIVASWPYHAVMNVTNSCNLRCKFCEISYLHKQFPKKCSNTLSIDDFVTFQDVFKNLYQLDFYGSIGEPLMNPILPEACQLIKNQYPRIRLFMNTNGQLLDDSNRESLMVGCMDDILISVHAGNQDTYRQLSGANFEELRGKLKILGVWKQILKQMRYKSCPKIGVAFALNRLNFGQIDQFLSFAKEVDADYIAVSNYYHTKNELKEDISYTNSPEMGNAWITKLYSGAKTNNISVYPTNPPYLGKQEQPERKCMAPWTNIKFEGCLSHENCHNVGICNRIILFRLNYSEFNFKREFAKLWNHPILQYLRRTANREKTNPMCAFCKNQDIKQMRCESNEQYRKLRNDATKEFFNSAKKEMWDKLDNRGEYEPIKGLTVLSESPYE